MTKPLASALLTAMATCRLFMRWSGTASQNIAGPVHVMQMQRADIPHSVVGGKVNAWTGVVVRDE